MNRIYLDQASTSFPKPPAVAEAVYRYMTECGCSISRGGYAGAYDAEEMVFDARERIARLFHGPDPKNVIFTKNVTESLNVLLKGLLRPGDHVLVSSMEHNAVMRPLTQLAGAGVRFTRIPCAPDGSMDTSAIAPLIETATRAVVMTGASNVCGTVLPVAEVGAICRSHNLRFLLDAAQTAGVLPIDMEQQGIDAIAFTGHKGLLGPQGIGGFVLTDALAAELEPLLSGGTGSMSHTEEIPAHLPDRFEPGTPNLPGIAGLRAALLYLNEHPEGTILAHELALTEQFLAGLRPLQKSGAIRIVGVDDSGAAATDTHLDGKGDADSADASPHLNVPHRIGVVSIQPQRMDPAELAFRLDDEYSIATRVGLHCAPSAHRTLGTFPTGTVRFSFGVFSTPDEIDAVLAAVRAICE